MFLSGVRRRKNQISSAPTNAPTHSSPLDSPLGANRYAQGKSETAPSAIAMAFVGAIVPDEPAFHSSSFSRAGNMFQENLLASIGKAGLPPSLILSQRPTRAFPRTKTLWHRARQVSLASGLRVTLLPFLNLPGLRPVTVGLMVLIHLLRWGWVHRHTPQRIIFTLNLTEPPGLFTLLAARFIGAKAVASINDIDIPGQTVKATLARQLDFRLQKALLPRFDGLIVVNQQILADFAPQIPSLRIEGGIREEVLLNAVRSSQTRSPQTPFTIVSAGTVNETNGFVELLAAFRLLQGPHYRLRIAGTGPLVDQVKQAAAQDPRIEYWGYLSFAEVFSLYQTADVLINMRVTQRLNTTYFFPSKLIEYLASGIPVISTCTGHVEEAYGELVYLLRDETAHGLAQMIERVAAYPAVQRAEKGEKARTYIQTHMTWEAHGRRFVDFVFDQVVNRRTVRND